MLKKAPSAIPDLPRLDLFSECREDRLSLLNRGFFSSMYRVDCRGQENCSETGDKLSFLRRTRLTATPVCETPSTSSIDALCQSGG